MDKIIALVPARSGSVRIKHKNLRQIAGVPLVAMAVQQATMTPSVDRVFISTDSELYAEVAANYGAEVPFMRPAEISKSDSTDLDVFDHFLDWYQQKYNLYPELVVQVRPTAPARSVQMIEEAIRFMQDHPEYDSLRSVSVPHQTPYKMWFRDRDGELKPVIKEQNAGYDGATQMLPQTFAQDGIVDIIRPSTILKKKSISGDRIAGIVSTRENWDIDRPEDLRIAAAMVHDDRLFGLGKGSVFGGSLGIIQGRLTQAKELQCFPAQKWKEEFPLARQCGYHCIELIRDQKENPDNPLWSSDSDLSEVESVALLSGIGIRSICDDYVQNCEWENLSTENYKKLVDLLCRASKLNVQLVVYPLFQKANIDTPQKQNALLAFLNSIAPLLELLHLSIALEISSSYDTLERLFANISSRRIGLCVDTGNLHAAGICTASILKSDALQERIMHIHLKDRDDSGNNVVIGYGNVDFGTILGILREKDYSGCLITETARGLNPLETAIHNRVWLAGIVAE